MHDPGIAAVLPLRGRAAKLPAEYHILPEGYEAPADMFDELHGLLGQRTIIACIAGQVRAGACHDW